MYVRMYTNRTLDETNFVLFIIILFLGPFKRLNLKNKAQKRGNHTQKFFLVFFGFNSTLK